MQAATNLAEQLELESEQGYASSVYGYGLVEAGRLAAARPYLRHALALREKLREPAQVRAATRFQYARALWPLDRQHAMSLAQASRLDLQAYLDSITPETHFAPQLRAFHSKRLTRIDRWIRDQH